MEKSKGFIVKDNSNICKIVSELYNKGLNLYSHMAPINSVIVAGNSFISASNDGEIIKWELQSFKQICKANSPYFPVKSLCFNPHENFIISSSHNLSIEIWSFLDLKLLYSLKIAKKPILCLVSSYSSNLLCVGSSDTNIYLYNLPSQEPFYVLSGHYFGVTSLAITKFDTKLVSGSIDKTVRIWNLTNFTQEVKIFQFKETIRSIIVHETEDFFAVLSWDGVVKLVNFFNPSQIQIIGPQFKFKCIDFIKKKEKTFIIGVLMDNKNIYEFSYPRGLMNNIKVEENLNGIRVINNSQFLAWWKNKCMKILKHPELELYYTFIGHTNLISYLAVVKKSNLVISYESQTLAIWSLDSLSNLAIFHLENNLSFTITQDLSKLIVGSPDVKIYSLQNQYREELTLHKSSFPSKTLQLFYDDNYLLYSSKNEMLIWNFPKKALFWKPVNPFSKEILSSQVINDKKYFIVNSTDFYFHVFALTNIIEEKEFVTDKKAITCISLVCKEEIIAAGTWDSDICLWRKGGKDIESVLSGHTNSITCLESYEDYLLSGSSDCSAILWNAIEKKILGRFCRHTDAVSSVAFVGKNSILTSSNDGMIIFWDTIFFNITSKISFHHSVTCAYIKYNSNLLIAGLSNGLLKMFNVYDKKVILNVKAHERTVQCLAVTIDEKLAFSGSLDRAIKVWNLSERVIKCELRGHSNCVWSIKLFNKDRYLASLSWDRQVFVWDLNTFTKNVVYKFDDKVLWGIAITEDTEGVYIAADNKLVFKKFRFRLRAYNRLCITKVDKNNSFNFSNTIINSQNTQITKINLATATTAAPINI